jgi:hypothetical protein
MTKKAERVPGSFGIVVGGARIVEAKLDRP